MKPTILMMETLHEHGQRLLEAAGEVVIPQSLDEGTLLSLLPRADAVVARGNIPVTRSWLEAAPRLKVVGRQGIGVDSVDVAAAAELGIWVVNTPEGPTLSVSEHFFLLALALCRQYRQVDRCLRRGDWDALRSFPGIELDGKTVGFVGFGRIGQLTARKCHAAFNTRILYSDMMPAPPEAEKACGAERVPMERLLAESDLVAVLVPLTPETHHLIGAQEIAQMKPTAYLINLCRGPVWDEGAVLRALVEGRIAGAATDVFEQEPPGQTGRMLLALTNFVATPHTAALTEEALARMSLVAEDIVRVLKDEPPRWPVNRPPHPRAGASTPAEVGEKQRSKS